MTDDAPSSTLLARFARPTAAEPTTLAVVSDPHVAVDAYDTWKVFQRTEDRLRAAVADLNGRAVDAALFTGDLTKDGDPREFDVVDAVLDDLDVPHAAIPGNHDVPKEFDDHDTPPIDAFADRYPPGEVPFAERFGGVDVVGLNTASSPDGGLRSTHDGGVSAEQVAWLADALAGLDDPIVAMHHNLPGVVEQFCDYRERTGAEMSTPPLLRDPDPVVDALAEADVPLVLSGHVHFTTVAETAGVRELVAPPLCSFPQGYLLLDVGPSGTAVRFVPVGDQPALEEAFVAAADDGPTANGRASLAAIRIAGAPLVDERE